MKLKHLSSHTAISAPLLLQEDWNALPPINLNLSLSTIENHLKMHMWQHSDKTFSHSNLALLITFGLAINALSYINHPLSFKI